MADLKNLYDYQTTDVENVLEIISDTVFPLTSSTRKYIFRLEPTGVLDENSLLLFKLKSTRPGGTFRVNQFNGVLGALKRCVFSVGDFVLNDTDEVENYISNMVKIEIDDYVVNDFHVNSHKFGLGKFAEEGALVIDEYLDFDVMAQEKKKFYIKEKKIRDKHKTVVKNDSNSEEVVKGGKGGKGDKEHLEFISWSEFSAALVALFSLGITQPQLSLPRNYTTNRHQLGTPVYH